MANLPAEAEWLDIRTDYLDGNPDTPETVLLDAERLSKLVRLRPSLWAMGGKERTTFTLNEAEVLGFETSGDLLWEKALRDRIYRCHAIRSLEQANKLGKSLRRRARDDEWVFEFWLSNSHKEGATTVAVSAPGDRSPSGFVSYHREVTICPDWHPGSTAIRLSVTPEYLYVIPSRRGKRLSSVMLRVMMRDVFDDAVRLRKALSKKTLEAFVHPVEISPVVHGEIHSDGGESFVSTLSMEITDAFKSTFARNQNDKLIISQTDDDFDWY